ncbi:hypothetical protein A9Q99_20235 [Gammaproteobacteria bacterium 45_16_T64]|nr:hypothetical protein A9Q99_20235 [Gammaproteobacteria bacterium 45_16_T64]
MTDSPNRTITVRLANKTDYSAWDSFVETHPNSSPYHLSAWKSAVEEAYKHRCYYLIAETNNAIIGVLPIVHIKPPLLSGSLCSLPFCDLGGILTSNDEAITPLIEFAQELSGQYAAGNLHLRQSKNITNSEEPALQEGQKVRMLLALPDNADTLLSGFKSKLRSQIKKSTKNGITYSQHNDSKALDSFYSVMQSNMRMLGSPVHSKQWFAAIVNHYGEKAQIGLVSFEGKVVGAAIILMSGDTVTVPWASTLAEYNRLSPNMGLYWGLLSYAADSKHGYFDFGRSSIGEGTFKFKKQWGATPLPLDWKDYDANGEVVGSQSPPNRYRDLVATTWSRLPAFITNILGPIFRRYISL